MSTEQDKFKHSKRLLKDENAINKQTKIAKAAGMKIDEPHRLVKHHAMDCGNPQCPLCGNPRKIHKDTLTVQEKKLFQDTEQVRDKHSNGLPPTQE
jgi:hypothetical protein